MQRSLLVFPCEQTSAASVGMSQKCQRTRSKAFSIIATVPRHAASRPEGIQICAQQASAAGRFAKSKTERLAEHLPQIRHVEHHDSTTLPGLYELVRRNQIGREAANAAHYSTLLLQSSHRC
jgi:hypothetical protein